MWLLHVPLSISQEIISCKMATVRNIPPDVERQFEASYEYTLPNLPSAVAEGMLSCCLSCESETESPVDSPLASVTVQAPVFLSVIIGRIILVKPCGKRSSNRTQVTRWNGNADLA